MKTDVTTPQGIFGMPQHLTVPIYQRPYVWNEDDQWGPLWGDIRRIAEHRLGAPGTMATHFLGAVVTQQAEAQPVGCAGIPHRRWAAATHDSSTHPRRGCELLQRT